MSGTTGFTNALQGAVNTAYTYQPQRPAYSPTPFGMGFGGFNPYANYGGMPMFQPNYWNNMAFGMAGLPSYSRPRVGSLYSAPSTVYGMPGMPGMTGNQNSAYYSTGYNPMRGVGGTYDDFY